MRGIRIYGVGINFVESKILIRVDRVDGFYDKIKIIVCK